MNLGFLVPCRTVQNSLGDRLKPLNARILGLRPGSFGRESLSASDSFYPNRKSGFAFSFGIVSSVFGFYAYFHFALMPRGTYFLPKRK